MPYDMYDDADLSGEYARDTRRRGYGDDYARESRWGGSGARGDYYTRPPGEHHARDTVYVDYGPAQTRYALGGDGLGGSASTYANYRGRGPRNYRRSNERIAEEVNERLSDDPYVDASDIEVRADDGVVHLSGRVRSRAEKRRAEDVAAEASGVYDVMNALRVSGNDREVEIGKASE